MVRPGMCCRKICFSFANSFYAEQAPSVTEWCMVILMAGDMHSFPTKFRVSPVILDISKDTTVGVIKTYYRNI